MNKKAWKDFINLLIPILAGTLLVVIITLFLVSCSFYYQYAEPSTFNGKVEVIAIEADYAIVSAGFVREFWKLTGKTELYLNYLMVQYEDDTFKVKKRMVERYNVLRKKD